MRRLSDNRKKIELDSAFNIADNQFNDGSMIHYIIEKGSFVAERPNTVENGFNKKARSSRNFKTRRRPRKEKYSRDINVKLNAQQGRE